MSRIISRRRLLTGAQYALGIVGLGWVVLQANWMRTASLLVDIPIETVLALITVTIVGLAFRIQMWHSVIGEISQVSLRTSTRIDFVVNFINQLLPSRLTGRGAAPYVIRRHTGLSWAETVAITALHTALHALLYGVGAVIGVAFGVHRLTLGLLILLIFATGLYFIAGSLLLLSGSRLGHIGQLTERVIDWLPPIPIIGAKMQALARAAPAVTGESATVFSRLLGRPRMLLSFGIGWFMAMLLVPGIRVWLLLEPLGGSVTPTFVLPFFLMAAYSVTILPLTPGGIGVTEATATLVFIALGVPAHVIVPVVFIDRFIGVYLPALSGWIPSVQMGMLPDSPE